jgi:hypothetical protein
MTLVSNAQTAQTAPTEGRLMIYEEASTGTITLDTDLKGYVSRDGGTTYTQTPLTLDTTYETGKRLVSGSVDISGQPSGTNMRYKIETFNQSKDAPCNLQTFEALWFNVSILYLILVPDGCPEISTEPETNLLPVS